MSAAPQPQRDPPVVDHLRAERSIGGCQGGAEEPGEGPRERIEHQGCDDAAEGDRQWQTDAQESHGERQVVTQLSEIDAGCIGEQHERECHLGERVERVDLDVDLHQPPIGIGEEVADDDEHERPGDAVAAQ